eukprot:Pgem_evm2s20225
MCIFTYTSIPLAMVTVFHALSLMVAVYVQIKMRPGEKIETDSISTSKRLALPNYIGSGSDSASNINSHNNNNKNIEPKATGENNPTKQHDLVIVELEES